MSLLRCAIDEEALEGSSPLGRGLIRLIRHLEPQANAPLEQAVSRLCDAVLEGDLCLDLKRPAADTQNSLTDCEGLLRSALVGRPGERAPLILDDKGRLYFYRHWLGEVSVAEDLRRRATQPLSLVDPNLLVDGLNRLFGPLGAEVDWQRVAACVACLKDFSLITGGPGTGKTSIVVKVLALLQEQALADGTPLRAMLAAPTGKAAVRLSESIAAMKKSLTVSEAVRGLIPDQVLTLHRLLGARGGTGGFKHNSDNPLPCDLLVLDEASMVDLRMMEQLLSALPEKARIILLGDRNQLCSVEAGSVLGDLCALRQPGSYSEVMARSLEKLCGLNRAASTAGGPLGDSVVALSRSYRFDDCRGIGRVSRAVNQGDADAALNILKTDSSCRWIQPDESAFAREFSRAVVEGFRTYLQADTIQEALERFTSFMVLCALRQGERGIEAVNSRIEKVLEVAGLICVSKSPWYRGRPVMVTRNCPHLGLFNGDMGLVWPDPEKNGDLQVFFPTPDGTKAFSPARLAQLQTVYAMTVHKSQGSEYREILLLLPAAASAVLTRELIYTAITRARESASIWGSSDVLRQGISRRVERASALAEALHR